MFGYITADIRKMTAADKAEYKSAYCGLCRALSVRYGALSRFLLSFDTAFLLLVLCQSQKDTDCKECACPWHFGRKRVCKTGYFADYCADVTVLITCLKFQDDIQDENSLKAKLLKSLFKKQFEKAKQNTPALYNKISDALSKLSKLEKNGEQNPDLPADVFGRLLAEIFSIVPELYDFGYYLGRFIYLCDAVCDFRSDLKHKRYNPLVQCREADFEDMLSFNIEKCIDCTHDLNINSPVIENVLRYGVWLKYSIKYKREVI